MSKPVEYYPLTHPQKAIWYSEKLHPNTSIGNVSATLRLKGEIDYSLLERAINLFIEKNDGMRLRIIEEDGEPKQYISDFTYHKLELNDFSQSEDPLQELYKYDERVSKIPFKLIKSDLFYYSLVKVSDNDGGIYVKTHHLISDAWTMSIMVNQVVENYISLKNGINAEQEEKPSYKEYILAEEEYKKSERFIKDREYWHNKFETLPEPTILKNHTSKAIGTDARRKTLLVPKKLTDKMRQYCTENRTSVFTLFLAALSMYINRITAKEDLVLGTITLNRSNARERETVGIFANMIPIRIGIDDNISFKTLIETVSKESMSLLRHQKYPLDILLKEVREKNRTADNLFEIILNYQNTKFNKGKHSEEYITRWHYNSHQGNVLYIHINDREDEGHLIIDYDYLTGLFYAKELEFVHQHIINLLWHALDNPAKKISRLEMLSEREKYKILHEFNDTKVVDSQGKIIHPLFEEQVERKLGNKQYILDANLNLMPIGIAGDLYISVIDEKLPKESLVQNPFGEGKLYKTGHTARWYSGGDIELLNDRLQTKEKQETSVMIAATFTSEPVGDYIKWWGNKFGHNLKIKFAGYNQVFQELLNPNSKLSRNKDGINIVLIRFEDFIRDDNGMEESKIIKLGQVLEELKEAISAFNNTAPLITAIFPVSTHLNLSYAVRNKIKELNESFEKFLSEQNNIYTINLNNIQELYNIGEIFDGIKDKEGHMPFTDEYYAAIGTVIARKICAIRKQHFKVIVLDCDNTLWRGICGEQGALGVEIEGAYRQLQEFMLEKYNQGMLLAICSKNNEKDVIEVFEKNPQMVLNQKHITSWKVNWQEKSQSIKEIADELNLSIDSFIYIDDDALECSKMIENCPEVLTLQLPLEEEHIPLFLKHVWAFDRARITREDALRNSMYEAEQKRKEAKETGISLDEFIKNLGLKISMRVMGDGEIERASQLTQRTNQFNLSTIRRTEQEIRGLTQDDKTRCFVIEASDRFGDYGIIGLVILAEHKEKLVLDTFLLSCRILGRRVEDVVLSGIRKYALEQGEDHIEADFIPTEKNKPIKEFLERFSWSKIEEDKEHTRYDASIDTLLEKIDYIDFYYNGMYEKNCEHTKSLQTEAFAVDHVAIAVKNMKEAEDYYKELGYSVINSVYDPLQNSYLTMCSSDRYLPVELVAPVNEQSPSYNMVEMHGEQPYHLCYRVSSIKNFLQNIQGIEYEMISDEKPAVLFNNQKVAFILVKKVGLIELVETETQPGSKDIHNRFKHSAIRIVVNDLERAVNFYKELGYVHEKNKKDSKNNLLTAILRGYCGEMVELAAPLNKNAVEYQFLTQSGAGIYQILFKTEIDRSFGDVSRKYNVFSNEEENNAIPSADAFFYNTDMLEGTKHKEHVLPLSNSTGKRLLQLPIYEEISYKTNKYEAPRNEVEEKLAEVWKQILRIEKVGIDDNFFELGGDSLGIMQLLSGLYKYGMEIDIQDIYKYPTIRELSEKVNTYDDKNEPGSTKNSAEAFDNIANPQTKYIKTQSLPLADLILSGDMPPIDAAALVYDVYGFIVPYLKNNKQSLAENLDNTPILYSVIDAGFGCIGTVFLPILGTELYSEKKRLISLCEEAVQLSGKLGAKAVSLTGLIPSATEYGSEVVQNCKNNSSGVQITTGHTTTSAAVILSLERLLAESRRDLTKERLFVLGLGSIGTTAIKLLLSVLPHPLSITLCDIYEKSSHLMELEKKLKEEYGFKNEINVAFSKGINLPDEIYQSTLIMGATNVPNILDINKLKPGTLIIDDSGPHCFAKEEAVKRLKNHNDILFTEGGNLEVPSPTYKTIYLPPVINPSVFAKYQQHFFSSNEITGCILSGLLSAKFEQLKPSIGSANIKDCNDHYNKLGQLGLKGASLHCDDFILPQVHIERFRKKFGSKK